VRDIINGVGHQRYINRLEQRTSDPNIDVDTADENLEEGLQLNHYFNDHFTLCI